MRFFHRKRGKNALLVINPVAGKMRSQTSLFQIVDILCKYDYSLTVQTTRAKEDATGIVNDFGEGKDLIVCASGDGTLNEVISGALMLKNIPPIGYIPTGSTNDFASSLGIPKKIKNAVKHVVTGTATPVDIGKFNDDRYFTYVASFGAFTETSYQTPQSLKNVLGHFAYLLEGIKEIVNIKTTHMTVCLDSGEVIEDDFIFGAVSNSKSIGGVLRLSEDKVSMSDGVFEIMLIKAPANLAELSQIINDLTTQKFTSKLVTFCHSSKVTFKADKDIMWSLDGECVKSSDSVDVECMHGAVSIIL
ncbi:MAG: diacylglycerol kinase family lipid kinase [Clostridia bacterium]|nr:diacylglycerol kinase family lipid kinase [Clostridia bacterium]